MNGVDVILAAVVSEHSWDRTVTSKLKGVEPQTVTTTFRTAHRDPECPRIAKMNGHVVASGVALGTPEAGLSCEWCFVDREPEPVRVPDAPAPREVDEIEGEPGPRERAVDPGAVVVFRPWKMFRKPNRYGGDCILCGGYVEADAGWLVRNDETSKFGAVHRLNLCTGTPTAPRRAAAPAGAPAGPNPIERPVRSDLPDVPEGHYAIASNGSNDLMFVRVDRPTDGQWAGRTFVKMIVGGKPDAPVRGHERVADVLRRIVAAGITEAGARYGREIGRCYVCNRTLTDETSRALGIGPECRKRGA